MYDERIKGPNPTLDWDSLLQSETQNQTPKKDIKLRFLPPSLSHPESGSCASWFLNLPQRTNAEVHPIPKKSVEWLMSIAYGGECFECVAKLLSALIVSATHAMITA